MAVYVDNMEAPFGRMVMCHCWADTREELFEMMRQIGVDIKWFQQPPKASWEHFDIAKSKRQLAIKFGAIETDKYGPVEHCALLDMRSGDYNRIIRGFKKWEMVQSCRVRNDETR